MTVLTNAIEDKGILIASLVLWDQGKGVLTAAGYLLLARLIQQKKAIPAALLSFFLVPVPTQTLASQAVERTVFGDLKLPPMLHVGPMLLAYRKHGLWRRHQLELEQSQRLGGIYCTMRPSKTLRRPSLAFFVSDPEYVEEVLSDRDAFPSRGKTGFNRGVLEQGLVALPTDAQWQRHRRVYSRFLTDKFLNQYSGCIGEEIEVLLSKWGGDGHAPKLVNAQYDLSVLTEDIIGRIALGQRLERQLVSEEDNQDARDRDVMMKEVLLRTMKVKTSAGNDKAAVKRIQHGARGKTEDMVKAALAGVGEDGKEDNMVW